MEHDHVDHVITIDLEKEDKYHEPSSQSLPSSTDDNNNMPTPTTAASPRSCLFCRKTLLLSYFNCCAVCLSAIESNRPQKQAEEKLDSLPTVEPSSKCHCPCRGTSESSSVTMVEGEHHRSEEMTKMVVRHCDSGYCKYTHLRPVLVVFALCEILQFACFLVSLNMALYCHDWLLLRYAGLILLQWWQIFMLSRQWNCGQSIVPGQFAAAIFMVWYYVESSKQWQWWEPLAICSILLKIVFPW